MYYSDYEGDALKEWQTRLRVDAAHDGPSWCVFDNTAAFAALGNALSTLEVFGGTGQAERNPPVIEATTKHRRAAS